MKTDLTSLPYVEQLNAIGAHLARRITARPPGQRKLTLHACDLFAHFKHRGFATRAARLAHFSKLQREALGEMMKALRAVHPEAGRQIPDVGSPELETPNPQP